MGESDTPWEVGLTDQKMVRGAKIGSKKDKNIKRYIDKSN